LSEAQLAFSGFAAEAAVAAVTHSASPVHALEQTVPPQYSSKSLKSQQTFSAHSESMVQLGVPVAMRPAASKVASGAAESVTAESVGDASAAASVEESGAEESVEASPVPESVDASGIEESVVVESSPHATAREMSKEARSSKVRIQGG